MPAARALLLTLALTTSCSSSPPGAPHEAVERFFAAIAAGDCAALLQAAGGAYRGRLERVGCEGALADFREHRVRLRSVEGTTPDGRDPRVRIVRATVERDGKASQLLLRVEPQDGRWVLLTL